jgi:hypothetical protein
MTPGIDISAPLQYSFRASRSNLSQHTYLHCFVGQLCTETARTMRPEGEDAKCLVADGKKAALLLIVYGVVVSRRSKLLHCRGTESI